MQEHPSLEARIKSFESYLIVDRGMSRSTARMRANIVRHFLVKWRRLDASKEEVQRAKESLTLEGYHRDYVGNICLAFNNYGQFLGVDLRVKPPSREKRKVPRFLSEQEVQSFLFAIDSVRDRALFTLLAYTGMRCAELCNLKREDVNFEGRTLIIQNGKGGKSAEIPVARVALDSLSDYLRSGLRQDHAPWLFHAPDGKKLSTNRVRVLAHRYGKQAGLPKRVSPHMFRHALATNLLAKGCPLPFVQRQLRHSRIETTMGYLHLSDSMLQQNYERFLPAY